MKTYENPDVRERVLGNCSASAERIIEDYTRKLTALVERSICGEKGAIKVFRKSAMPEFLILQKLYE